MKKRASFISMYLCLLLLFTCGLGELLFVDKAARPSETENRMLQGFPTLSAGSVASGEFMDGFESYLSDGFFFREAAEKIINRHKTLSDLDKYSGSRGFVVMLIARMVPYLPSVMLNAIGALSAMKFRDYVIASFVGKFPSTGIEAIIGHDAITHQEDPTRMIVVIIFAIVLIVGAWLYERHEQRKK